MFYTVNLSQDNSRENMYLSTTLLKKIEENIKDNKKTILYLNKRGAFSCIICKDCSYLYECPKCDASFSVHNNPLKLLCHLCGTQKEYPITCKNCSGNHLKSVGVGTQQIEIALKNIFPKNNIFRFDADNIKNKTQKKEALKNLKNSEIIIGTKMITTGFDFSNVGLIGILLLEQELSFPKYDIEEKVYTNIKQLIGRGERKGEKTDIILQTFIPQNDFVKSISEGNYKDFFTKTLEERKLFSYPPFTQMATLQYRDINKNKAENFMKMLNNKLQNLEITKKGKYEIQYVSLPFKKIISTIIK